MARDPNKYREDEDFNDTDDEEEEEEFDGRPEQSSDEDDGVGMEGEAAESPRRGRRGAKSHTGRRDH